jgi:hypothetical protein
MSQPIHHPRRTMKQQSADDRRALKTTSIRVAVKRYFALKDAIFKGLLDCDGLDDQRVRPSWLKEGGDRLEYIVPRDMKDDYMDAERELRRIGGVK